MLGVSAVGHLLLLGMVYAVPSSFDRPFRAGPRAINVDLVSLPAPGPPQPAPKAAPTPPPPAPKTKPEPVPPPPAPKKKPVSIAPQKKKPKVVKSLKKKTAPKQKAAAAVTRPAPKKQKPQRTRQVSSAIEAMRQKVAGQEQAREAAGAGGTGAGGGDNGSSPQLQVRCRLECRSKFRISTATRPQFKGSGDAHHFSGAAQRRDCRC